MTRPYRLSPLVHSGMLHACVADDDNDGVVDPGLLTGASLRDARAQGIVEDNCQFVSNRDQKNSDTDALGDDAYNNDLSKRRAESVVKFLADNKIAKSRLRASGAGESRPVAGNDTEDGRAKNRRVEFVVVKK